MLAKFRSVNTQMYMRRKLMLPLIVLSAISIFIGFLIRGANPDVGTWLLRLGVNGVEAAVIVLVLVIISMILNATAPKDVSRTTKGR